LAAFLVEDWVLSAMLGFITAILSISVDVSYEYINHCEFGVHFLLPGSREVFGGGLGGFYSGYFFKGLVSA
jgi:hypothetical protein